MKLTSRKIDICCAESEIYNRLLSLDNKHILELGCGSAEITRDIANSGVGRRVTAMEVDEVAYNKNLQTTDLPNVSFVLAGAQEIPLEDESVDVVFMFKSLHHVPIELMADSMLEIYRVLKQGGLAYISEPVFAGDFNEILRLFHDEEQVRIAAFQTIEKAVDDGLFKLFNETFFNTPVKFVNFQDFEHKVINATHTHHRLNDDLYLKVKQSFDKYLNVDGANFFNPVRVDLLEKI